MRREGVLVAPADSAASSHGLHVGSSFFAMSDGTMVGGVPWTLQPEMETDMAEVSKKGLFVPRMTAAHIRSIIPLDD